MTLAHSQDAPARPAPLGRLTPVLLGAVALLICIAQPFLDHVSVADRSGLARVSFGLPFGWLSQDQSSLDPSFPSDTSFLSPWEHSVDVAVLPLVADVLVVYVVLLMALFAVHATRRRIGR